jgi:hypothetical protein
MRKGIKSSKHVLSFIACCQHTVDVAVGFVCVCKCECVRAYMCTYVCVVHV